MDQFESNLAMQASAHAIGFNLPEVIVQMQTTLPPLPAACPCGQIDINRMHVREAGIGYCTVDSCAVLCPRKHPHVVKPGDLPYPVPPNSGLRAFAGLTRVGGHENPQSSLHCQSSCNAMCTALFRSSLWK